MLSSFLLITLAELGDKTMLLTLTFAACYPWWEVILAITSATALLMAGAVMLGGLLFLYLPLFWLKLIAGSAFIIFGLLALRTGREEGVNCTPGNPFLIVFSAFLLAELGDKTQLGALALSASYGRPLLVWLGATAGMLLVNFSALFIGRWLKDRVPERWLKLAAAAVFIGFGLLMLGELVI